MDNEEKNIPEEVDEPEVENKEQVDADEVEGEEVETPDRDENGLKQGFGRDEYSKTVGDKDYYKKEAEELKKRQQEARMEQANRYKKKSNGEETEEPSSNSESTSENGKTDEKKSLTKEERDEQTKSATTDEKEKKNLVDRAKDARNTYQANMAVAQNKINQAKAKAYAARHPVEAAKAEAKNKIKKKVTGLLLKYWWVFAIAALVLFIILFIFLIILGASSDEIDSNPGYLDPKYDYSKVIVRLTNSYTDEADKEQIGKTLLLEDFVIGVVYYETRNYTEGMTDDELFEFYKSYVVLLKTEAFKLGGYNNETMEITIKSGADLKYCDAYYGCVAKENNGNITYYSKKIADEYEGTVVGEVDAMDSEKLNILEKAYLYTTYELLVPETVKEAITDYSYANPEYNKEKREEINSAIKTGKTYDETLESVYDGYTVYNIKDYATYYTYSNNTAYWWPIGSSSPSSGDIYGGTPTCTSISSEYGYRIHPVYGGWKFHSGVDIPASCNSIIIATRSGTVTSTGKNDSAGNYIYIDHGDGTSSAYFHIVDGGILVNSGDSVKQGQKIALVGTTGTSTGCHLHFEIRVNGSTVDPLDYIDAENPRPVGATGEGTVVEGSSNVQTVCLSLKASGFSNEAVAGIMANIERESGFRPNAVGDSGTSFGICQWHNGRGNSMKSYCGSNWDSDVGCQVKYLIYELQNSETGAYNALLAGGSAYDLGAAFCIKFERPADQNACYTVRGVAARDKYYTYVKNNCSN